MPNWAFTQYRVKGDEKELKALSEAMEKMSQLTTKNQPIETDFGTNYLGNLVALLGGDVEKVYCRGTLTEHLLSPSGELLTFSTETAWRELGEIREFLKDKFPSLEILYNTEEPGMCEYYTNDPEWYKEHQYFLDCCIDDSSVFIEPSYFPSLEKVTEYMNSCLNPKDKIQPTLESIDEFTMNWQEEHENDYFSVNHYELVYD